MLTIPGGPMRTCEGVSRRDFMNIGAASLLGLSLPEFLSWKAAGARTLYRSTEIPALGGDLRSKARIAGEAAVGAT